MSRPHTRRPPRPIDFPSDEEWLELPRHPSYLVSTHGRMYTTIRRRLMAPQWLRRPVGRPPARIWCIGPRVKRFNIYCGHTVLSLFGPPRPSDFYTAAWLDGDRSNCHIDNLAWTPRLTNVQLTAISRTYWRMQA